MRPANATEPLSSEELARDERQSGTSADRTIEGGDNPHFPASEGAPEGAEDKSQRKAAKVESDITLLPPG